MDEGLRVDLIPFANPVMIEHSMTARKIAEDLEVFTERYPDAELRRETAHIICRLRRIAAAAE